MSHENGTISLPNTTITISNAPPASVTPTVHTETVTAGAQLPERFQAVLIIEGEKTTDGRLVNQDALTWRELPIPLMLLTDKPEQGHTGSEIAGSIEKITRKGSELLAEGTFDLGGDAGREAARLVQEQVLRWVSADLEIIDAEIKMEGPGCDGPVIGEDGDCEMTLEVQKGRVMGATIVAFPAFPGAVIVPEGASIQKATEDGRPAALAAAAEFVSEKPWDGSASRFSDAEYKRAAAVCRGNSDSPKQDCSLPHHEPGGQVSRAGVHAAAGRLNQTTGLSSDERSKARSHLAAHYRNDLSETVPDSLKASALVASSIPVEPPASWFEDPALDGPTALTITPDGRVFGHAASWGQCHLGVDGYCLTPPESASEYAYFRTGAVRAFCSDCDKPEEIATGVITLATDHAGQTLGARETVAHYENTGVAVADVAVGQDAHGIWVAGALRPGVTDEQIRTLRGASLSGDWRRIGGNLELVGLLAVNIPGFPITRPTVRAHVASGVQTALVAAGSLAPADPAEQKIQELSGRVEALEQRLDSTDEQIVSIDDLLAEIRGVKA